MIKAQPKFPFTSKKGKKPSPKAKPRTSPTSEEEDDEEDEEPSPYGDMSEADLNGLIPLESRSDPDAETVSKALGCCVEVIHLYYPEHIVYPAPRKPSMQRRTVYGITSGRIKPKKITAA